MQTDNTTQTRPNTPIALTIAGSDSGGGAGIQADLKAFSALGVYGASAITAITAQNTCAVTAVHGVPTDVVLSQIKAVLDDIAVDAIKIGMLSSPDIIEAVAKGIDKFQGPVVLDPVMVAKSGDQLLQADAIESLKSCLLPRADLLTPNLPEAAVLLNDQEADGESSMLNQGSRLLALGAGAVLMKGGHAKGSECVDLLIDSDQSVTRYCVNRVETKNTHGTGCTLSSSVAAGLARGLDLEDAVAEAHAYLHQAILASDKLEIGAGHGPVHHFHSFW